MVELRGREGEESRTEQGGGKEKEEEEEERQGERRNKTERGPDGQKGEGLPVGVAEYRQFECTAHRCRAWTSVAEERERKIQRPALRREEEKEVEREREGYSTRSPASNMHNFLTQLLPKDHYTC